MNLKAVILIAGLGRFAIDETIIRQYRQLLESPDLPPTAQLQVQTLLSDGISFFNKMTNGSIQPLDRYMSMYSKYWIDWINITKNGFKSAARTNVSAFVLRGTADTNVTAEDFEALKLATQSVPGSSALAPPNLDHMLAEPGTTTVSPTVLDHLSAWLKNLP
ncbi:MAG: hypothetical protein IPJ84_04560 [Bdellovibrionales bacterium]|nr:hypothetical protein [Bdellovibrionales bacterium]